MRLGPWCINGLECVDCIEVFVSQFKVVEVGENNLDATIEFLKFPSTDVRLRRGIGHAHNFDVAPAREVISRGTRSASEIQKTHPLLNWLEKGIVGFIGMGEDGPRKNARAVIVVLGAIKVKHVVVCTILVIVLQEVVELGRPVDELTPFKLVQRMADIACILRMDDKEIEDVMKEIICREQPDGDCRYCQKCRTKHGLFLHLHVRSTNIDFD